MDLNEDEIYILKEKLKSVFNILYLKDLGYTFKSNTIIDLCVDPDGYINLGYDMVCTFVRPTIGKGFIELNADIKNKIKEYGMAIPYDNDNYDTDTEDREIDGFTIVIDDDITLKCQEYGIFNEESVFSPLKDGYFIDVVDRGCDDVQIKYLDKVGLIIIISSAYFFNPVDFIESYIFFLIKLKTCIKKYEELNNLKIA